MDHLDNEVKRWLTENTDMRAVEGENREQWPPQLSLFSLARWCPNDHSELVSEMRTTDLNIWRPCPHCGEILLLALVKCTWTGLWVEDGTKNYFVGNTMKKIKMDPHYEAAWNGITLVRIIQEAPPIAKETP